ncbi:MAG: hypothetical protein KF715_19710 [Candidatus Didemnitutus sp.]|nr:hypothetical protein [Candidatus Didemnitutus sp.]
MKLSRLLLASLVAARCSAQWIVNDPVNTAVNSAIQSAQITQHAETLRQWADQLEMMGRQISRLEEQLATLRRVRDVMGDPAKAAPELLRGLEQDDLGRRYGETLREARRLADAVVSLQNKADGIFDGLDDRTVFGRPFQRQSEAYRRFAAIERQATAGDDARDALEARASVVQREIADTLRGLEAASTQAEVDKLSARLTGLNGQLGWLSAERREQADRLLSAKALNDNQAEKERLDWLEKQNAEERQSLDIVNAWQSGLRLNASDYQRR